MEQNVEHKVVSDDKECLSDSVQTETSPVAFADFTFNSFPHWLKRKGQTVKISPKSALILSFLIENRHRTVLKEEIKTSCWPEPPTEDAFNRAIKILRNTLGDERKNGEKKSWHYIVNPKTNVYALKPRVYNPDAPTNYASLFKKIVLAATLVAGVATATIHIMSPPEYQRSNSQLLTTSKGDVRHVAASPDKILVFSHKEPLSNDRKLRVMRQNEQEKPLLVLESGVSTALKHSHAEPSFSPSGNQLAWVQTDYRSYCDLMTANFNRDSLTISNLKSVKECNDNYFARSPQWRTETSLLASLPQGENRPNNIYEIDLITGETYLLTSTPGLGNGDIGLYYNADADKMVHLRRTTTTAGAATELMVYDFKNGKDRSVKLYGYFLFSVAWKDKDHLVVKGKKGFELLNLDGESIPLSDNYDKFEYLPFSIGYGEIGYIKGNLFARDIQIIELNNGSVDTSLSSIAPDYRPVFAKDTHDIVFASQREGSRQIFASQNDVTRPITNFTLDALIADLTISWDGETVAYLINNQLSIAKLSGEHLNRTNGAFTGFSFTPDNHNLIYGVTDNAGQKIVRMSLRDFSTQPITSGYSPRAIENGDIYFLRQRKSKVYLHKISPQGGVSDLGKVPFKGGNSNTYDVIDNVLYYVNRLNDELFLMRKDLDNGAIRKVTAMESTRFSLNKDASKVITTKKVPVQNNIASFTIFE